MGPKQIYAEQLGEKHRKIINYFDYSKNRVLNIRKSERKQNKITILVLLSLVGDMNTRNIR